jgi:hypothetical protein
VLEQFASVFTVLDARSFRDVFATKVEVVFEQIVENSKLPMLVLPQNFLAKPEK